MTKQKIYLDRLLSMLSSMYAKIIEYIQSRHQSSNIEDHRCKICEQVFGTGRQLGGHMSRKHPGMSDTYNSKRFIHNFMRGERARR
jgi:hypothetical protein